MGIGKLGLIGRLGRVGTTREEWDRCGGKLLLLLGKRCWNRGGAWGWDVNGGGGRELLLGFRNSGNKGWINTISLKLSLRSI